VTLLQCELAWEAPADNRSQFAAVIAAANPQTDLIVLPEMFTTGFSMNALANAEEPGGPTEQWLLALAREYDCAVTGSIAVRDGGAVYNRLLFATPDALHHYDKRHLFRMAGEHQRYAPGSERVIVEWRGWRIKTEVCYDLRFPVFSRNRGDYDLLLNVANWPAPRAAHWRALLPARAIENLACVVGVNRIGRDANGLDYVGDSVAIDARGDYLANLGDRPACETACFSGAALLDYRERFPSHLDADAFSLQL
jgi:predicted amidohydrolase